MTATVTPSPWPGGTGCRWSSACPHRHSLGHLRAGAERGNTDWNPTPRCHPGICFIAALWSIAGVAFSGIIPEWRGKRKLPLKSHCSKWSAQMPRWDSCVRQPVLSPWLWKGLMGRDECTCHWVPTDCYRTIGTLGQCSQPSKKIKNLFNIKFYTSIPSSSQTSDTDLERGPCSFLCWNDIF